NTFTHHVDIRRERHPPGLHEIELLAHRGPRLRRQLQPPPQKCFLLRVIRQHFRNPHSQSWTIPANLRLDGRRGLPSASELVHRIQRSRVSFEPSFSANCYCFSVQRQSFRRWSCFSLLFFERFSSPIQSPSKHFWRFWSVSFSFCLLWACSTFVID